MTPQLPCATGREGHRGFSTAVLHVPPPLIHVSVFLAGVGIGRVLPLPAVPSRIADVLPAIGATVLALGIVLGPANALMFLARGTTLNPARAPRRLFTGGLYRITRNPMYVGLMLIYAGVALLHGQWWSLLLMPLPFAVVDRIYIPFEEQRLRESFGPAYEGYCRRVRRWLGWRHRPG